MQVILLEDLDRIGHEGDVLTVADGFARNYLIPKKLAVHATKGALKDLELRRKAISQREDDKRTRALRDAEELAAKQVTVKARAGEGDRLHGQVTPQMIAAAALEQHKLQIDRRDIDIAEPIRELGDYLISVKLYKEVAGQLPISVVRDTEAEEAEAALMAPKPKPGRRLQPEQEAEVEAAIAEMEAEMARAAEAPAEQTAEETAEPPAAEERAEAAEEE
jgi:large subunit ribosomal protein L9